LGTTTRSAYDGLQRLTGATETPGTTYAYTYDLAGNRTDVRENGALVASLSYNDANQVIGWSYDAAGNLLSDGTTTRSYDALNRLVAQDEEGRSMLRLRLQRRRRPRQRRHHHVCAGSRRAAEPGAQ